MRQPLSATESEQGSRETFGRSNNKGCPIQSGTLFVQPFRNGQHARAGRWRRLQPRTGLPGVAIWRNTQRGWKRPAGSSREWPVGKPRVVKRKNTGTFKSGNRLSVYHKNAIFATVSVHAGCRCSIGRSVRAGIPNASSGSVLQMAEWIFRMRAAAACRG